MKTTTDYTKEIRTKLKETFPSFKWSVTKNHYCSISIVLLSAPFQLLNEGQKYRDINNYYINDIKNVTEKILFSMVNDIASNACEITYRETGDYGTQPSTYINLSIGKYDKPYKQI